MKKCFLLALCFGVFPFIISAQNLSFEERFEEANLLTEENELSQALVIWADLADEYPDNGNVNYKTGRAYLNSYSEKTKALPYLKKAVEQGISESYNLYSPTEKQAPVEAYYYLGTAYHLNYYLKEAIEAYQTFLEKGAKKHYLRPNAEVGIAQSKNAQKLMQDSLELEIVNLGPVVNSEYPDFSPVISLDENSLFYTSRRLRKDNSNANILEAQTGEFFEDIYVSYRDRQGNWQEPELLNINTSSHTATMNVSADGQRLFIYRDDNGDGNIYESRLIGETWTEPVKMDETVNSPSWETHLAISADENTMFFVSNRKGGFGGRDVYRVVKLPNGEWSKALNLGPSVNTELDEDAVFISPDGRTLYFSSQGHSSMGGFDIFTTTLDENGDWTEPRNLGYPLNTVDDDIFFVTSADGTRGYFSSIKHGGQGEKDIYMINLPSPESEVALAVLRGYIIPPEGEKVPETAVIYVTNNQTGQTRSYSPRTRDGVFVAILPPCAEYSIDYRIEETSIYNEYITIPCESAYQEINKEIILSPVSLDSSKVNTLSEEGLTANVVKQSKTAVGDSVEVKTTTGDISVTSTTKKGTTIYDQYFDYNEKSISLDDERFTLFMNDVAQMLKTRKELTVTIEGSASTVPTKTFGDNKNLANQRASDAKAKFSKGLNSRGIDTDNITFGSVNGKIQGPKYQGDYLKGKEKYGKYQYIRIVVE